MMTCNGSSHNPSLKQIREMATLRKTEGQRVEKYQSHVPWLRDRKFLSDLENDSVDSEILEEELCTLQEEEPCGTRQKVAKYLQSHPVQVILCVVVILDAGIVIAQILLDLHYFREKHYSCEEDISTLLRYLHSVHGDTLAGFDGSDIDSLVRQLQEGTIQPNTTTAQHISDDVISPPQQPQYSQYTGLSEEREGKNRHQASNRHRTKQHNSSAYSEDQGGHTRVRQKRAADPVDTQDHPKKRRRKRNDMKLEGARGSDIMQEGRTVRSVTSERGSDAITKGNVVTSRLSDVIKGKLTGSLLSDTGSDITDGRRSRRLLSDEDDSTDHQTKHQETDPDEKAGELVREERHQRDASVLHNVSHYLHIASICILGFLVVEDLVKAVAMGREFCKHKVEVVDAAIILSSFIMDIVLLGGVPGDEGEKAAAVLVVLLLWRIARVIDGIVVTVKQKQEFRIRLQKRARRKAEKRIDNLEEDRHYKTRQVQALRELCQRSGVLEEEIEACIPKKRKRTSSTASALTSVARLSVSMTMSMSSGLFSLADDSDKTEEFPAGKSPDISYAKWKRDSTPGSQDGDGSSVDSRGALKSGRGMSLPDFRQRGTSGLMASPCKKDLLYSPSPTCLRRDVVGGGAYSPGQSSCKREMLYNTIKEESPASSCGNSATTSPVNASGIKIFIDTGSDNEDCSTHPCDASCAVSCDHTSVVVTSPEGCTEQPLLGVNNFSTAAMQGDDSGRAGDKENIGEFQGHLLHQNTV